MTIKRSFKFIIPVPCNLRIQHPQRECDQIAWELRIFRIIKQRPTVCIYRIDIYNKCAFIHYSFAHFFLKHINWFFLLISIIILGSKFSSLPLIGIFSKIFWWIIIKSVKQRFSEKAEVCWPNEATQIMRDTYNAVQIIDWKEKIFTWYTSSFNILLIFLYIGLQKGLSLQIILVNLFPLISHIITLKLFIMHIFIIYVPKVLSFAHEFFCELNCGINF